MQIIMYSNTQNNVCNNYYYFAIIRKRAHFFGVGAIYMGIILLLLLLHTKRPIFLI